MARVTVGNIRKAQRRIKRNIRIELNKLFKDKDALAFIGEEIGKDIRKNFKGRRAQKSTIEARKRLEPYNNTDPAYKRNRAKAIFTGQLLDDLSTNVKGRTTQKSFIIEHSKKKHKGYKAAKKRTKRIDFRRLSEILIDEKGINYFKLSRRVRRKISKKLREIFLSKFKN